MDAGGFGGHLGFASFGSGVGLKKQSGIIYVRHGHRQIIAVLADELTCRE